MAPGAQEMSHCWVSTLDPAAFTRGALGTLRPAEMRPAAPGDWQLTVVPLLGFDRAGYRLGYGKGHYDKLLAGLDCPAVGVAFAGLELPALPHEPHDIPLDLIVTERELIIPARSSG
jgi:5-formyltetrahydrofolate cyclo-ligase